MAVHRFSVGSLSLCSCRNKFSAILIKLKIQVSLNVDYSFHIFHDMIKGDSVLLENARSEAKYYGY